MEVLIEKITFDAFVEMDFPEEDAFLYELLNGELVKRNAPSGEHQFAQSELFYRLMHHVTVNKLGRVFSSPTTVILSETDAPQPDLIFLSNDKIKLIDPEWGIRGIPDMVVEIVSPTSYKRDHFEKKKLYASAGVSEYWIVDPSYHSIEVFVLQDGSYQVHAFGIDEEVVTSSVLKEFSIVANSIFLGEKKV